MLEEVVLVVDVEVRLVEVVVLEEVDVDDEVVVEVLELVEVVVLEVSVVELVEVVISVDEVEVEAGRDGVVNVDVSVLPPRADVIVEITDNTIDRPGGPFIVFREDCGKCGTRKLREVRCKCCKLTGY